MPGDPWRPFEKPLLLQQPPGPRPPGRRGPGLLVSRFLVEEEDLFNRGADPPPLPHRLAAGVVHGALRRGRRISRLSKGSVRLKIADAPPHVDDVVGSVAVEHVLGRVELGQPADRDQVSTRVDEGAARHTKHLGNPRDFCAPVDPVARLLSRGAAMPEDRAHELGEDHRRLGTGRTGGQGAQRAARPARHRAHEAGCRWRTCSTWLQRHRPLRQVIESLRVVRAGVTSWQP